ncbi:hypothetical protein Tco_0287349 [Tanacetum coccineum]
MVAFLEKPTESAGFEEIINFLNASHVSYALTVSPTIYTSCIKQLWGTAKAQTVNEDVQIHAKVDGQPVVVTESTIRRDLHLEDVEGIDCLPNAEIFEQLSTMGYEKLTQKLTFYKAFFSPQWMVLIHIILQCLSAKTISWNKFSSTMASAIICLATNRKFNFSKYILGSMVKNVSSAGKFLMYPRFMQVFLDAQVEGMEFHTIIYEAYSHSKKVFANMKRQGKDFTRRVTHLFPTMLIVAQQEDTEVPQPSGPEAQPKILATQSNELPLSGVNTLGSGDGIMQLNELMELCAKLFDKVLALETAKASQAKEILQSKKMVKLVDVAKERHDDTDMLDTKVFKGEEVVAKKEVSIGTPVTTAGVEVPVSVIPEVTKVEITLAQALAKLKCAKVDKPVQSTTTTTTAPIPRPSGKGIMMQEASESGKNVTTQLFPQPKINPQDKGNGIMIERPEVPKSRKAQIQIDEEVEKEKKRAGAKIAQEASKKQKDNDEQEKEKETEQKTKQETAEQEMETKQETAKLKVCMEVVSKEEGIEVVPLVVKSLIYDWKIHKEGRKSYYHILRAGRHDHMFLTFSQILLNFDREDLEVLYRLVMDRYGKAKPVEDLDLLLWGNLKTMFEPHVEDEI